jgi:putative tryptophan/tyrosine transport system substrate-binding protein
MKRRKFISLLGGAAAWPLAAHAQQSGRIWRMGFIAHGHEKFYDALFDGLRELGYEEGRNLIVERRYAQGRAERFQEFAAEMVRLNVDIIIVVTTPAALAVKKATTTIPIVHPNAIDPLNTGLIASLAHPGGNLTGGAQLTAEVSAKRLEILKRGSCPLARPRKKPGPLEGEQRPSAAVDDHGSRRAGFGLKTAGCEPWKDGRFPSCGRSVLPSVSVENIVETGT